MFASRFRNVRTLGLAVLLLSATTVAAGAQQAQQETSDKQALQREARVKAQVTNNHWLDIRVYAVADGREHRLGTVTSFSADTFTLPRWFADVAHNTQLVAYPIGSRSGVATPILLLVPGDVIQWRVENNLNLSNVAVFGTD